MYYKDPNDNSLDSQNTHSHYDETDLYFSSDSMDAQQLHNMHNKVVPQFASLVHFIDPDFNAESRLIVSHFDAKTLTVYGVDEHMRCRTVSFDCVC